GLVGAVLAAAFLAQKPVTRPRPGELGAQHLLGASVGGGDEVGRALERDLQLLDLAEVALEAARRLAGGGDHDVEESRAEHGRAAYTARRAGATLVRGLKSGSAFAA